jgi:uncharacterized membrane-anchored protein
MNLSLKIILPVFIIVGLAQWLVPAQMIWKHEEILQKGNTFRFLTEPVDPSNPFIGKYITLNFKEEIAWVNKDRSFERDQTIYVLLKNDSAGFAHVNDITANEPTNQTAYVKAKVNYISSYSADDSVEVNIDYPFDEFYMEEHKAPKAEAEYRKANRDTAKSTYAQVKIWKGNAVTENVYIDNKPLTSYFK